MNNLPPSDLKSERQYEPKPESPRVIRSEELFGSHRLLLIEHAGQQYRLLITRNDRLILQK